MFCKSTPKQPFQKQSREGVCDEVAAKKFVKLI